MTTCENTTFKVRVSPCGEAESTLVAVASGSYKFNYTYLGQDYSRGLTYQEGEKIMIKGEWFNEVAKVIGHFVNPDGAKIEVSDGVNEISVTVAKLIE